MTDLKINMSTAAFLVDSEGLLRCVSAVYEKDGEHQAARGKPAKRSQFKTFDRSIKAGDFVIVPTSTRFGLTVVKVDAVDTEVDFESEAIMQWVIGTVSTVDFEALKAQDAAVEKAYNDGRKAKRLAALKETLDVDSGVRLLAITSPAKDANYIPEVDKPAEAPSPLKNF